MMTTMAAIFGTLPIAIGIGAGAESPPTSRRRGGRRPHRLAGAHPVHDAGDLPLHGEVQRVGLGSICSTATVRTCTFGNAG